MRTSCTILAATALVLVAAASTVAERPTTAPANSVTGTWTFTLRVEDLTIDSVAELKQVGGTITGTVITGAATKSSEIKDGKRSGRDVRFTVDRVQEQGTFETRYSGNLAGDEIRGEVEFGWIDLPDHADMAKVAWVATRVKDGTKPTHGVH